VKQLFAFNIFPASIELSNYYFHQISSFCCINARLQCCWLPMTGGPACARSPVFLLKWEEQIQSWNGSLIRLKR